MIEQILNEAYPPGERSEWYADIEYNHNVAWQILESLASKGEIREKIAGAYWDFTIKQGWELKGYEADVWQKSYSFADEITPLINADKELALREQAERIKEQIIEAIDNYDGDYPDSYERGRLLPAFCDGVDMAKAAIQAF